MRELVLVHGRSQEHKDGLALKREWLDALHVGLQQHNLTLPIPETAVRFPYYGQTLFDLVAGVAPGNVAEIVVRGAAAAGTDAGVTAVLEEILKRNDVSDDAILDEARAAAGVSSGVVERGPLNRAWVVGLLSAVDKYIPGVSGGSIALFTRDVFQYLRNPGFRDAIDAGVLRAMTPGVESVVVGHSLGSVVSYNLLRRDGAAHQWKVPVYITVGAPLAVTAIRDGLKPIKHPSCVGAWFNARDEADVVALYPLDAARFPVTPAIVNKSDVHNTTSNKHGIAGYLSDPEVALRIYQGLVGDGR